MNKIFIIGYKGHYNDKKKATLKRCLFFFIKLHIYNKNKLNSKLSFDLSAPADSSDSIAVALDL